MGVGERGESMWRGRGNDRGMVKEGELRKGRGGRKEERVVKGWRIHEGRGGRGER